MGLTRITDRLGLKTWRAKDGKLGLAQGGQPWSRKWRCVTRLAYPRLCFQGALLGHTPGSKLGTVSGSGLCSQLLILRATWGYFQGSPEAETPILPSHLHPEIAKLACITFHFLCVSELSRHPNFCCDWGGTQSTVCI